MAHAGFNGRQGQPQALAGTATGWAKYLVDQHRSATWQVIALGSPATPRGLLAWAQTRAISTCFKSRYFTCRLPEIHGWAASFNRQKDTQHQVVWDQVWPTGQ